MEIKKIYAEGALVILDEEELHEMHEWLSSLPLSKLTFAAREMKYTVNEILEQM